MDLRDGILEFIVEAREDGGYSACSTGACVFTESDSYETLMDAIREAVHCHFDEDCMPKGVRLRWIKVIREEVVSF